ncbi:phage terminase large subunit [Mucilaginibacter rivuli]|uniref:phage terminase large subunit n=1 Tax=Mucilaginibacter rivuli TaxID=2857527 RepID=UPI0021041E0B|nr:phage terminase large subunit [Mucilaginibacter rivuli]
MNEEKQNTLFTLDGDIETITPAKQNLLKLTAVQKQALQLFNKKAREVLLVGGSRSGKTFIIIYKQLLLAAKHPGSRHLIARYRFNHVKHAVWADTLRKLIRLAFTDEKIKWKRTDYYIEFDNGSQIWLAGLDDKDRTEKILGMEFLTVFLNEASQISYEAYTTIKTRLAQRIQGMPPCFLLMLTRPAKSIGFTRYSSKTSSPKPTSISKQTDLYGCR